LTSLSQAIDQVLAAQRETRKPLAIVVAGHNGSGKSTMWRRALAERLQIPLINADRMMLSILPEPGEDGRLTDWAITLRDTDRGWMGVAQQGVNAFVGHAMGAKVPFAMETVFSYWEPQADGSVRSKVDLIRDMQTAGYFVLLVFVGLADADLSVLRVMTRVSEGGHNIDEPTLRRRFPKTQTAVASALAFTDAAILADNSRTPSEAFTVCRVQLGQNALFDVRTAPKPVPSLISAWLTIVAPVV